ncbi:MAG: phosphoadenosine phosphosulfate reductase domain-containing protein [Acidobacteriaceae bacterium]
MSASGQRLGAGYARIYKAVNSGGKDSVACVLHLIEMGVPREKIELHHHIIDGREGSTLMDWPVTEAYCEAFGRALGLRIFFSWKIGGFEREMTRQDALTAPIAFEREGGGMTITGGERGKTSTRHKFPQVSPDLRVRWCSAYLKVDVGARVLMTEPRFLQGKTLVVTGERAEESKARACYATLEPNRCDRRSGKRVTRHIDHWRPVHAWSEEQVWAILERHRINPHPAYWLGWGRCSCRTCIFGSANQWATVAKWMPMAFQPIADYERKFGVTIHRIMNVEELAAKGQPYELDARMLEIANKTTYDEPIILDNCTLPPGAFKESAGPT